MSATTAKATGESLETKWPDYLLSPNAVLGDKIESWRYGKAPDYTKTRKVFEEGKRSNHEAGSLPQLVENLVKNWEVEASFKTDLKDWRTVNPDKYTFGINGNTPQDASHMLKVGTYNAIIAPNDFYSPNTSDFASSHKTFKRMMPNFAWEVLEVYSPPPVVAFKWRHWGYMKNDYVGFNDKGEKIRAKAHGGIIDIQGVTVASLDDKVRVEALETWFDPLEMFRQIAPEGIVTRSARQPVAGEDLCVVLDEPNDNPETQSPMKQTSEHSMTRGTPEDNWPTYTRRVLIPGAFPDTPPVVITETRSSKPSMQEHSMELSAADRLETLTVPAAADVPSLQKLVADLSIALDALKAELAVMGPPKTGTSSPQSWVNVNARSRKESDGTDTSEAASQSPMNRLDPGQASAVPPQSIETRMAHEEMGKITGAECPFMNKE